MGYHIVNIDSAQCSLSCKNGQLVCKTGDKEKSLPLEDVASIIITSFSAQIHSHLFLEAAKHGVALIICEAFRPVSLVLPANRSTDTLLSRALLDLTERTREQLWQKTVDAKCQNQAALAEMICGGQSPAGKRDGSKGGVVPQSAEDENCLPMPRLSAAAAVARLRETAQGKKPHKEAICAKLFWQSYGIALGEDDFSRERSRAGLNALLNYGYAVLLSTVLQKLFAVGLDPTWGISHMPRERAAPLAYDLMEPFRPCVDWRVFQWAKRMRAAEAGLPKNEPAKALEVSREFRAWVTAFPLEKVGYLDFTLEIQGVIEGVVRSFRRAVMEGQTRFYKPWTPRNSKWDG
jgi:CRISP-associated protein Cas1